jgi:hypothetical protein
LVVNDQAPIARGARGYKAPVASEDEEALEIFNSRAPGLVVTELSMPKNGRVGVVWLMASALLYPSRPTCNLTCSGSIWGFYISALGDLSGMRVLEPHNLDSFRHWARQSQLLPIKALDPLQKVCALHSAFTNSL